MTVDEQRPYRLKAWSLAFVVWVVGAGVVWQIHRAIPVNGWWKAATYLMYFLEFWYLLALGELHRCFYELLTRNHS